MGNKSFRNIRDVNNRYRFLRDNFEDTCIKKREITTIDDFPLRTNFFN